MKGKKNLLNDREVNGYTYDEFIHWMELLVSEGKTTGNNQSASLVNFTALNLKRMQRIGKTIQIEKESFRKLAELKMKQNWIVITEGWCGDSAQTLPLIHKIAETFEGNVSLKVILRDSNPEWIEKYHTDGSRSIPKLISFDEEGNELFIWGPRPEPAQRLLLDWKSNRTSTGKSWDDFEKDLHTWYARDKGRTIQSEFIELITTLKNAKEKLKLVA